MKKQKTMFKFRIVLIKVLLTTLVCFLALSVSLFAQNIGINATGSAPDANALLDVDASGLTPKKGLLIPRMTSAERDAIPTPITESLLIYNTTTQCFEAWNQSTTSWVAIGCLGGCNVPPTTANAGSDQTLSCGTTSTTLAGNTPTTGTGQWSVVSGSATVTTPSSPTSAVTGLAAGSSVSLVWTITNPPCSPSIDTVVISVATCGPTCGSQTWMAANLDVGTMINASTNQSNNGIVEKYCYNNLASNCATYGGLYQWGEAMQYAASVNCDPCGPTTGNGGVQGICPAGYHIPSDLEWSRYEWCIETTIAPTGNTPLSTFQNNTMWRGTASNAGPGAKMKTTSGWTTNNGTNASGFAALPAGYSWTGTFGNIGVVSNWWTSTSSNNSNRYARHLDNIEQRSYRSTPDKLYGFSVRCLQD